MRRMALGAALLALVAVGCKAEINVELQLDADGSGTFIAETGFDEEFEQFAFQDADPQEAIFEDNQLANLPNAEFSTFEEGEFTFYRITVPFEDVNAVLAEASADAPLENVQIEVAENEVRVTASTEDATTALFESEDLEGFDADLLADTFSAHVRLKMPGSVTSHNADSVLGDGTLEWDVPLTGPGINIQAASDPTAGGGGGLSIAVVGGIAAVAVLGAGAGFLVMRRRKDAAPEPALVGAALPGDPAANGEGAAMTPPLEPVGEEPSADEEPPPIG